MSNKQTELYNENLLEELISQNEDLLQDIHAEKYAKTDDPDEFELWLSNLDLDDVQKIINVYSEKE